MVADSKFERNSHSGLVIRNTYGSSHIVNTISLGNGQNGIHAHELFGDWNMINSSLLENSGHGLLMVNTKACNSNFERVLLTKNQLTGARLDGGTGFISVMNSDFLNNNEDGLSVANQADDTSLEICNGNFSNNVKNGLYLQVLKGTFRAWKLSSGGNSENGVLLQQVSKANISSSLMERNARSGLSVEQTIELLKVQNVSTSYNQGSGLTITNGKGIVILDSWSSDGNGEDGLYLLAQDGWVNIQDSFINENKRRGIYFCDGSDKRLQQFRIQESKILLNQQGGINLSPLSSLPRSNPTRSISIELADNLVANNSGNGIQLSPVYYNRYSYSYRKVYLTVERNFVLENKGTSFYVHCPAAYKLTAKIQNNSLQYNTGNVMTISDSDNCGGSVAEFPVNVEVQSNHFFNNSASDHVLFMDYYKWPQFRFALVKNNTFIGNVVERYRHPSIRRRTIAKATVVVKEGNFTIVENVFDNPQISHQMATLLFNYKSVVVATSNWWGAKADCDISDVIFDFQDRLQLAAIEYFPFLLSTDRNDTAQGKVAREFCFMRGKSLGGALDRDLILADSSSPYNVVGDIIVLPNASLTIHRNVTLVFPPLSAFLVQGIIFVQGDKHEKVNFVLKKPSEPSVRLADGPGPWEGFLEIKINETWMSVCLSSFAYAPHTVCLQLGYQPYTYRYNRPNGKESYFIHNLLCDTNDKEYILQCNRQGWSFSSSCSYYTPYVKCHRNYWTGVHLAMTSGRSVIHNLLIDEAGYQYRSDISISGIALRIDFNHHDLQDIVVNNSISVCTQIMYPSPFMSKPAMCNVTMSNCGSHGLRFDSPYLHLKEVSVHNTGGYGLTYESNWNSLNTHSVQMGDSAFVMKFPLCAENKTVVHCNDSFYFVADSTAQNPSCEHIIETTKGCKIGLQIIYSYIGYSQAFRVYDQVNKTDARLWKVQELHWQDRPVLFSNGSSLVLDVSNSGSSFGPVHFFVFVVGGECISVYCSSFL